MRKPARFVSSNVKVKRKIDGKIVVVNREIRNKIKVTPRPTAA